MKILYAFSILLFSVAVSAQELVVPTSQKNINGRIPLKEMTKFQHSIDNDNSVIDIELVNGAKFTITPSKTTTIDAVDINQAYLLGRLANVHVDSQNTDLTSFKRGDFIGIFHEDDYAADDFGNVAYDTGSFAKLAKLFVPIVTQNTVKLAKDNGVDRSRLRYHVADIVYASVDIDGEPLALSARLVYPYIVGGSMNISTVYLDNHFTTFEDSYAPSAQFGISCGLTGMASRGYLVVQPDLIGFGASVARTQQYVDQTINPAAVADCLRAIDGFAEATIHNSNIPSLNLSSSPALINTGASQGASTALGLQYYLEKVLSSAETAKLPTLSETRICAGAYNMVGTFTHYVTNDTLLYSPVFPLMIQGAVVAHPDDMKYSDGTPIRVHDFFDPKLEDLKVNMSSYGQAGNFTIWEVLSSKTQGSSFLTNYLPKYYGGKLSDNTPYVLVHRMLAPGIVNETSPNKYELNRKDDRVKALLKVLGYSNLSDASKWVPKAKITMTHAVDDTWVPYSNSINFYNNMTLRNADVTLNTLDKSADIGNHSIICYVWILAELYGWPVKTAMTLVRNSL